MSDAERQAVLKLYLDGHITAGEAADRLGPGTSISEVILETVERFRSLPDRRDAFTEGEFRRGLAMLGLDPDVPAERVDLPVAAGAFAPNRSGSG